MMAPPYQPIIPYREPLDILGELLTLATRAHLSPSQKTLFSKHWANLATPRIRDAARQNQIEWLVGDAALRLIGSDAIGDDWRKGLRANSERVQRLLDALLAVGASLDRQGIAWATVENGGIMLGSKLPFRAFCAGDLDLIIDPKRWEDAVEIFKAKGYTHEDRRERPTNRIEFVRHTPQEPLWLNAGPVAFDRMWVPLHHNDRCTKWLERRIDSPRLAGIWILCPEDALAFVAMHTSLHSFIRAPYLRLHVDVDRIVTDNNLDWDAVVSEIRAMGVPTRAFISLMMASGLLNTPISPQLLQRLYPGEARWTLLRVLLASEGSIYQGTPKLARLDTVLLDALISESNLGSWLRSILAPSGPWLQEHFARNEAPSPPTWRLQLRRYQQLFKRWSPR